MSEKDEKLELEDDYLEEEDTLKDKYLTFHLHNEDYAIEIKYVIEIIGIQKITEVPSMPPFVKGVINLRGKVIPVIDVRIRFNMPPKEYGDRTCIIVIDVKGTTIGLIVDEVSEVLSIPQNQVDPPPKTSKGTQSRYIQGVGKVGSLVKIILNVENLLSDKEREGLEEIS